MSQDLAILKVADSALCLGCDYPLRELSAPRCPECGRAFDAVNPQTYRIGEPRSRLAIVLLHPPGIVLLGGFVVVAGMLLWGATAPGGFFGTTLLGMWGGFGLTIIWVARMILRAISAWRCRLPIIPRAAELRRWLAPPALGAITIALIASNLPSRIGFAVSRPAMERIAKQVLANKAAVPLDAWAGVYPVRVESCAGGVVFVVRGAGFLDREGFVFSPSGQRPPIYEVRAPLGPGWWRYTDLF